MKIKLRTDVCGLIQPDTYGSQIQYHIAEYDYAWDEFKELAIEIGERFLTEAIKDTSLFCTAEVRVTGFWSPQWYNFQTDALEFDFEFGDWIVPRIVETYYGDEKFFEAIRNEFGSYDGFASFMPVEPAKFFAALTMKPNDKYKYDFERAISMVLWYEVMMSIGMDMNEWQNDYIDELWESGRENDLLWGEEELEEWAREQESEKEMEIANA